MVPSDPDRFPREANDISRAGNQISKKTLRVTLWVGVASAFFGAAAFGASVFGLIPSFETNNREKDEDRKEEAIENGPPVTISAGGSYYGPGMWVSEEDRTGQYHGVPFDQETLETDRPSWGWLEKHWTPLHLTGVSINVLSEHKKTTLVQGVEISNLACAKPFDGTLLQPPGIGDGGEEAIPVDMALNVDAARPVTRELNESGEPGRPFTKQIALEQGDQRGFVIKFFSRTKSCTFNAHLIVSSNGKTYRLKLPATWKLGEKPDSYTFRVSAAPSNHTYKSTYYAGDSTVLEVPQDRFQWVTPNQPSYIP
ncbi:hypothetical protein [Streptomyces bluensis]|uniref:hypothetical protein n=1 Tax=Streptomyces bluensis TaxID=33897 RepID=UPI00167443AB|nr:hypothetical protein [Streptomyces bluensis]GGZ77365.1 hypothetical protein GCM10010344_50540 [Streptomyces bluensis]